MHLKASSGSPLILFATGSTGGHVTPARAVGEALHESGQAVRTLYAGPAAGVAERMVNDFGGSYVPLEVHPIRGAGLVRWMRGLIELPVGAMESWRLLRLHRPDVVVGFGAHTSGPLVALAALMGIPTLLLEANLEVGLANRWLGRLVRRAAVAWPSTSGAFHGNAFVTGWPVPRATRDARRCGGEAQRVFNLLVLGGSGGAPQLDRAVRDALPNLGTLAQRLSVVHQAAAEEVESLRASYAAVGIEADVAPFFFGMEKHYRRASLVVTRAGAATLSELAAVGLPSIVVPLAAAGEHQVHNARAWEQAGCGLTVLPRDVTGARLSAAILALAEDRERLEHMSEMARGQHRADAASRIAEWCLQAARGT